MGTQPVVARPRPGRDNPRIGAHHHLTAATGTGSSVNRAGSAAAMLRAVGHQVRIHMTRARARLRRWNSCAARYPAERLLPARRPYELPGSGPVQLHDATPVEAAGQVRLDVSVCSANWWTCRPCSGWRAAIPQHDRLALNLSEYVNGAKRHAETSQKLFPGYRMHAITNGVHPFTWTPRPSRGCTTRRCPAGARAGYPGPRRCCLADEVSGALTRGEAAPRRPVQGADSVRFDSQSRSSANARDDRYSARSLSPIWTTRQIAAKTPSRSSGPQPSGATEEEAYAQLHKTASRPRHGVHGYLRIRHGVGASPWFPGRPLLNTPLPPSGLRTTAMKPPEGVPSLTCRRLWVEGCIEGNRLGDRRRGAERRHADILRQARHTCCAVLRRRPAGLREKGAISPMRLSSTRTDDAPLRGDYIRYRRFVAGRALPGERASRAASAGVLRRWPAPVAERVAFLAVLDDVLLVLDAPVAHLLRSPAARGASPGRDR